MSLRATILIGGAVVLVYLAAALGTRDFGVGAREGAAQPSYPYLLEDVYDRTAYQQRGRWIASGGTPYIDEFSEYPQLSTWLMALPYLFFDHDVEVGEPFGAVHAARAVLTDGGVPPEVARTLIPIPQPGLKQKSQAEVVRALAPYPGIEWARLRPAIEAAEQAEQRRKDELTRNAPAYGNVHHVLMALWFIALIALVANNLKALGERPAWALLLLLPGSLYYGFNRFDLVVTTTVAAAFFFQIRGAPRLAALLVGAAIMVKWQPIVILPLFLSANVHALRASTEERAGLAWIPALVRGAVIPGAIAGAVIVSVLAVTFVWDGGGADAVTAVFDWHTNVRKPNHSSFLALLTNPDNWGWFERDQRDSLERVFKVLQLAPGFLLALLPIRSVRTLVLGCLAANLFSIVFSEFFSPQWVLWLTAMGALVAPRYRTLLALIVALELVMYTQLPVLWYHLQATGEGDAFWTVTNVRMTLLLVFLATSLVLFVRAALARFPHQSSAARA